MLEPREWVKDWLRKANQSRSIYQPLQPYHVIDLLQDEHGITVREAYNSVYGAGIFPSDHPDWKSYARFLKEHTKFGIPLIGSLVAGWFGQQCEQTVRILLDESGKYREHKRKQDRAYWARVQSDSRKHGARKQAMRSYYAANRERILEQQREYRNRDN